MEIDRETLQSTGLPTGHDAPIEQRNEDFYDRWHIATAISRVIDAAPPKWSTRIGLFGRWGDGKTSVLNFLEIQQLEKNNIVIRYSPWGATTEEEVWKGIGDSLIAGLHKAGIKVNIFIRLWHQFLLIKTKLTILFRKSAQLAEATGKVSGATFGADVVSNLIQKHFKFTRTHIDAIIAELGTRKVIVFIDDLDRTESSLIPKLLLSLRELLDFSKFTFVLAFDKKIITASLETYNSAWLAAGEDFLSKVIDFPFDLPPPSEKQIQQLAVDQFAKQCPFVPTAAVQDVSKTFPSNPRKLKLVVRIIAATKEEASRHEQDELNWTLILTFAMIRVESEGFASALLDRTISSHGMDWGEWMQSREEREIENEKELDALLGKFPELTNSSERVKTLVKAWGDALPIMAGQNVWYQAMFSVTPHSITWGEFKSFFNIWRTEKAAADIDLFLRQRMKLAQQSRKAVEEEFLRSVVDYYSGRLEMASHVGSGVEHLSLMSEASDVLHLVSNFIDSSLSLCNLSANDLTSHWQNLYNVSLQWRHFNSNNQEPELRQQELDVLIAFMNKIDDPLMIYDFLTPGRVHDNIFGQRQADLNNKFTNTFRSLVEPRVIENVYGKISEPGKLQTLKNADKNSAVQYLLSAPGSPVFREDYKPTLLTILTGRLGTPNIRDDALTYLDLVLSGLSHGNRYCNAEQSQIFITTHSDLIILLWRLTVSERSQYRALQGMRERHQTIINAGISEQLLEAPGWLSNN